MELNKVQPSNEEGDDVPSDNRKQQQQQGCCGRFRTEFTCSSPWFGLQDTNGKTLDLKKSFCIRDGEREKHQKWMWILLVKFVFWGFTCSAYVGGWIDAKHPNFYMAYMTLWTGFYSFLYQTLSLVLSIGCCCTNKTSSSVWLINLTWILFSIASVHGMVVTIMFWLLDYDPSVDSISYFIIMHHGVTFALVVIDGLLINKTPVRLKHLWVNMILASLFIIWTVIQSFVPALDNPNVSDENAETKPLYGFLDWKGNPKLAAVCALIPLFVACPLFQILIWLISLPNRRYIDDNDDHHHNDNTNADNNNDQRRQRRQDDHKNGDEESQENTDVQHDDDDDIELPIKATTNN